MKAKTFLVMACLFYAAFAYFCARSFPPVNTDETVRVVMSRLWLQGERSRYPLYDDIFAQEVYGLRDVLPDVSIKVYHTWLGLWSFLAPHEFMAARFSSIAAGVLGLALFFYLGLLLGGARLGWWCLGLAALNPLYFLAATLARPESLLTAATVGILCLLIKLPERAGWKPLVLGVLSLLLVGIHPNGAVISLAILLVYLSRQKKTDRITRGLSFMGGGALGVFAVILLADPKEIWLGFQTIHAYLLRPPVLSWPWHPVRWLLETLGVMWQAQTFYFDPNLAFGWRAGVRLMWLSLGVLLVAAWVRPKPKSKTWDVRPWLLAGGVLFFGMVALVKAKECLYGINFLPFLIPVAAVSLASQPQGWRRFARWAGVALAIGGLLSALRFEQLAASRMKSYDTVVAELKTMLPNPDAKIAAPNVLWFRWDDARYRDSGAILISHWYTGGKRDVQTWLAPWRPDILVLDGAMQNVLWPARLANKDLAPYFNCPVRWLGDLDTGGAYGTWKVFEIRWAEKNMPPTGIEPVLGP